MKKLLSLTVLYYLRFWARRSLEQVKPIIIGVTGSAGKSTCVAAIEVILKTKYQVRTTGTSNSESGLPLSVLGLKMEDYSPLDWIRVLLLAPFSLLIAHCSFDILVCEMGIDELVWPKNMDYLLSIVQPKIGVFLNVLPAHTMQMKSVDNIAAEKGKLIATLPADGTAVVNKNDPRTHIQTRAKTVYFSGDSLSAARAVGRLFDVSLATSHQQLATRFSPPPGRNSIFKGIHNSTIIDSSYNASPVPVLNALHDLSGFHPDNPDTVKKELSRKIAVLGDMRELGDLAPKYHREVAKKAYQVADAVITVGPLCRQFFPQNPKLKAQFDNSFQAGKFLQTFIQPGDVVLFKGSQNTIFLEAAVEMCLANKTDAAKLCRRGKFWDKQRAKFTSLKPQ
ncbi:MAG: UDP-N-acetylmuramoyl-tripeptide--D-alanyl-D-alanine ligase [Patescibacteria group bacterium]|nr:UDP-N-acetylmuramoyl-tripeptide--D-alanyl-D-alanine ligase [Patescibacteria group bacterium]MCL5432094.1 UDP-N-acetylmuramoyl-tripeptide--D-alanyl-D-alanine ligase [Patescibacteria group bacterium]